MMTAEVPSTADIVGLPCGLVNARSVDVALWDIAPIGQRAAISLAMSALVKRFGCRPDDDGGGEEEDWSLAMMFDAMGALSTKYNDTPERASRPYDAARDGFVIAGGGGMLVLEELEHARARGAKIYAEIVGFDTNSDGAHVTQPSSDMMQRVMEMALTDAGLEPTAIGYVSAHGTATERGDIAESHATRRVLGGKVPVSSLKSYMGHTLGACGAIEAWWGIEMMRRGWFAPTLNLEDLDPACEGLDHLTGSGRDMTPEYFMSNNFAFGGINTSLIFRRI